MAAVSWEAAARWNATRVCLLHSLTASLPATNTPTHRSTGTGHFHFGPLTNQSSKTPWPHFDYDASASLLFHTNAWIIECTSLLTYMRHFLVTGTASAFWTESMLYRGIFTQESVLLLQFRMWIIMPPLLGCIQRSGVTVPVFVQTVGFFSFR